MINGELTVKRLKITEGKVVLLAENPEYPPIQIEKDMEFEVCVVTSVIHNL